MLINIVHPYTFKLIGDTLQIGQVEEFNARDKSISDFVNFALDSKASCLVHKYIDDNVLREIMHKTALQTDPYYNFIFDSRIDTIRTTPYGVPIPDEKPKEIPKEEWKYCKRIFSLDFELKQKFTGHDTIIFIGGVLEYCLINAISYCCGNYKLNNETYLYIPEFCVSFDEVQKDKCKERLKELDVNEITSGEAIDIIKINRK